MKKIFLVAACICGMAPDAFGGTIDLLDLPGNFNQSSFGATGTETYAQSITADDVHWSELSFGVSDEQGGTFDLLLAMARNGAGIGGTGLLPDASQVLFQTTLTHLGSGLQIFDVALDIPTIAGDVYFLVLNAYGKTLTGATVRATQYNGTDKYNGGEFIYSNTNAVLLNSLLWSSRFGNREDLAFRAVFDDQLRRRVISEPVHLGLAGLGMLALARGLRRFI